MPYINHDNRHELDILVETATKGSVNLPGLTAGGLNYLLTRLCMNYIGKMSYTRANEVVGVLECVKLELYRRALGPYEDRKASENGDVKEYKRAKPTISGKSFR